MPFLIDSNIGNAVAIKYVDGLPELWARSQVTAMELIVGARDKSDLETIDGFLSLYPVVPLSDRIGAGAYRLLKINPPPLLMLPDYLADIDSAAGNRKAAGAADGSSTRARFTRTATSKPRKSPGRRRAQAQTR